MFKNYIKIAFRNLWKHKVFSMINIISLSIGLSAAFVIGMMVYYDFTFDTFHKDGDRIYRIVTDIEMPEGLYKYDGVTAPMRLSAQEDMTGIEQSAYFYTWWISESKAEISEEVSKNPDHIILTDQGYFDMFSYEWIAGSQKDVLNKPNEVVLTQERAKSYFPSLTPSEVLGKQIIYNQTITAEVKGVVANLDERTDFIFQEFISLETAKQADAGEQIFTDSWGNTNSASQLFIKLAATTKVASVESQLEKLALKHTDEYREKFGQTRHFIMQPLSNIHFNEDYGIYDYSQDQASKDVLIGLAFIALFLLLLGSINFINLNTAQATQRAKEIGVRKTLGGSRRQLIFQFLSETFVITGIAALISVVLSIWMLGIFDEFIPSGLTTSIMLQPQIIVLIVFVFIVVALFSGIYPSLVLSHFKPAKVLKGDKIISNKSSGIRKALTVFQFSIAQVFIIATLLVGKQIHYMMNKDMGYDSKTTAYVMTPWTDASYSNRNVLATELKEIPQIENVSLGSMPPASFNSSSGLASRVTDGGEVKFQLQYLFGDENYYDTYKLQLLAGRAPLNDTIREYIINEAALSKLGFTTPQEAVDQEITMTDGKWPIVGVMKNFNQGSLKWGINPMAITGDIFRNEHTQFRNIHLSLATKSGNLKSTLSKIENAYKEVYPDGDFSLQFNDKVVANFYKQEKRISTLLNWATGLSVLISCLGLLGLVIHTTERRTKEIGIRKVLGASLAQLNVLLCKDFLILVGIAFVIAAPLAYWGLNRWLQDFAYKTEMSWWVFVLSGAAMVIIALVIMSIRTIATAMKNPVHSLKTE